MLDPWEHAAILEVAGSASPSATPQRRYVLLAFDQTHTGLAMHDIRCH